MNERDLIVVGVGGTPEAVHALEWALREARVRGAPVSAVTVCPTCDRRDETSDQVGSPSEGDARLCALRSHEDRMRFLSGLISSCMAGSATPELRAELVEGRPADVLVSRSQEAAMLVLGERASGDRREAARYSGTTWECVRRARCPVLVVPAGLREAEVESLSNDPVLD